MNPERAYEIASQWGSYMEDGDPGAVFYSFPAGRATVVDEEHRSSLIAYTRFCLRISKPEDGEDLEDLLQYFKTAETADTPHWWSSSDGRLELKMTREQASSMSHTGQCAPDVEAGLRAAWLADQVDSFDEDEVRASVKEYGAWDAKDLTDHQVNLERLVWLAAGELLDQWDEEQQVSEARENDKL